MKKKISAALVMTLALLTGCTGGNVIEPEPLETPAPQITAAPTEAPEVIPTVGKLTDGENHPITVRNVVNGKMQSYLTGEWKAESVVKRRNMAVMINNIQVSLPQYGISAASIIYEAPVEGRITRLMGFFEDYDNLDHIGSVRSARDYYLYEAMAYDSIYCNWGLARPWVEELINSDRIDNVSYPIAGIYNGVAEAFGRIDRPGKALEHTAYLFTKGYTSGVEKLGYAKEYRDTFVQAFTFAEDGYIATYDSCPNATLVFPGGTQSNAGGYGKHNPCFAYNADDGLYYRTQYGAAQVDEMNGQQVAVSNVVFKVCQGKVKDPIGPEKHDYLDFTVQGTGEAYVFTNGKVIKGTWKRDGDASPNLFYDEKGKEIVLNQGKTWICCIWKDYAQYMSWE